MRECLPYGQSGRFARFLFLYIKENEQIADLLRKKHYICAIL
jgi:hypothetical protein